MTYSARITANGLPERDFRAIKAFLVRSTVPLIYESGDIAGIQGSGCLFDLDGRLYFVTAGHVLDGVDPHKLGVPFRTHGNEVFTLGTGVVGWSRVEAYDVAAYRIDDEQTSDALRDSYIILRPTNVSTLQPGAGHFIVAGYPAETVVKQGKELAPRDLTQLHTSPYTGDIVGARGEYDLFLNLRREARGLWGNPAIVPKLLGISGGPVWQVRKSTEEIWTPESALGLVGIQVSCDQSGEKYVRALRWEVVAAALLKLAPPDSQEAGSSGI